ncbi:hypothetical protein LNP74_25255 [Klebsiella pneumoniae subsp. pneumoniae]|nr:hypothetical protein [Klebsiella pneumoniae subsp. pneumoniae]
MKGNFAGALRIELKKGFTNEGVVHELSWIPGVQTGGVLCAITVAERELTCDKKSPISANDYLPARHYALFGYLTADKSFREIMALCPLTINVNQL